MTLPPAQPVASEPSGDAHVPATLEAAVEAMGATTNACATRSVPGSPTPSPS